MSRLRRLVLFLFPLLLLHARPVPAQAQPSVPLNEIINDAVDDSRNGLVNQLANAALFEPGLAISSLEAVGALGSAFVYQTGAFPIGSSSGGFTWFFDASSGAVVRSSPSFGPLFAERPLTSGRGKLNVGMTFMHRSFSRLEDTDLDDGSLRFFSEFNSSRDGATIDLIESALRLDVTNDTTTFFATYGVMNRLDLSFAVPIQRVSVDADVTSQLVRFGPTSPNAIPAVQSTRRGTATGLGDVAVRAKYNVLDASWGAVAGGLDLRLPTGDENDLLGTGRTRTQLYAAITSKLPRIYPHANVGYTFKSEEDADSRYFFGSEFGYAAGVELVLNPRLTVVGDVIGRSLADEGRLQDRSSTAQLVATTTRPAESRTVTQLTFEPGLRLNSVFTVIGAKFNLLSTFIVSGHVLLPTSKAGIKSRPAPVIGIDYSF